MKRDDDPTRLADHVGLDHWIAGLLRSTGPYKVQPGRKRRVLLSLGHQEPRRAPRFLRPAIVVGMLIAGGAFASAAIGPWRGWQTLIVHAYQRVVPSWSSHAPVTVVERGWGQRSVVTQAASAAPPEEPAPRPLVTAGPTARREPVAKPRSHRAAPFAPAPRGEQDTRTVLEGMRALRVDRDPVRARALLASYLDRQPNGALAEEALALSIEAAVAHRDSDAAALAARYLRRYPAGSFCALARDAQR